MNGKTLLLVEDDREIRELLADFLRREGYAVEAADGGPAMDRVLAHTAPDLVILDLMLPGEDGLSICRRLRARGGVAILILTAKDEDIDRIVGLELGADDYMGKPFNPRELLARIRAVLRRTAGAGPATEERRIVGLGALAVDLDARAVLGPQGPVPLTSAEFDLLACFIERPRRVLSREQLLDWTRGRSADPLDRTIDVTVSRLRRKLETADAEVAAALKTVRNGGYLFGGPIREGIAWPGSA
jgi:two-component system OmpR family response regulator